MASPKIKKAALVTGAAKRIGQAMAITLAKRGYDIALHYHSSYPNVQKTAQLIKRHNVQCRLFSCDLSQESSTQKLISDVKNEFGHLNLLINSASIFIPSVFDGQNLNLFNKHFNINLKAPFILMSEFARLCKRGQIVNLLDTNIVKNKTSYVAYLLSKKALGELTKMAAVSLAPAIRVNGIAPGLILPPEGKSKGSLQKRAQQIPLKHVGNTRSICQSLEFLLDNKYLTGQILFNDGGEHLII